MKTIHVILLTAVAATVASVNPAIGRQGTSGESSQNAAGPTSGMLSTMPHGTYQCALPGDAGGAAFVEVKAQEFRISTASRYQSAEGTGTYILRGRELTFTRGPRKGEQFVRVGDNQLRKLNEDGTQSQLLCTRLGSR